MVCGTIEPTGIYVANLNVQVFKYNKYRVKLMI